MPDLIGITKIISAARAYADAWYEHIYNPSHGPAGTCVRTIETRHALVKLFHADYGEPRPTRKDERHAEYCRNMPTEHEEETLP